MADPSRFPDTDDDSVSRDRESTTRMPRWVKVLAIIALILVLVLLVLFLVNGPGGGGHGPDRHAWSSSVSDLPMSAELGSV